MDPSRTVLLAIGWWNACIAKRGIPCAVVEKASRRTGWPTQLPEMLIVAGAGEHCHANNAGRRNLGG